MSMPATDSVLDARDRAIIKFYLYTGARIETGCRFVVGDFHVDEDNATLRLNEKGKGKSKRVVGINYVLADALQEYVKKAGITRGPLFRPRLNPRSTKLAERAMSTVTMYRLLCHYLNRLPGAMKDGEPVYTPHSFRATTATLLLDAGEDILDVQELLGHNHVTTTQVYDKRRRATKESASHHVPL